MKIKGDKVKDNKPLLSGRLYRINENRTVSLFMIWRLHANRFR